MLGNKEIMAQNIKLYMAQNNVNATELCKALGIKQNTFSDWVNAKTYPRIDKIELMANYFGISKADLVESSVRCFSLSDKEKQIIELYRQADALDKRAVDRILKYVDFFGGHDNG